MNLQELSDYVINSFTQIRGNMAPGSDSADPTCESFTREQSVRDTGLRVFSGVITDVCPALNAFRVGAPNDTTRICTVLSITGGAMSTSSNFEVGDQVLVAGGVGSVYGVILGKIPETSVYGDADLRSMVTMSGSVKAGPFQKSLLEMLGGKPHDGVPAWTPNTPIAKTNTGELFIGSPVGPKFFIDPFMSMLSINDATGVWAFRDDSMLRVAGVNYQKVTSGSYEEELNDNGECTLYRGQCLNSWEQLGYSRKPDSNIIKEEEEWCKSEEPKAFAEPEEKDARPFHRIVELGGYIGKGKQSIILATPESNVLKYGKKEDKQLALSRIVQNTDGFVGIESAKGISLVKSSYIPSVQRICTSENEEDGDNPDNYDFDHANYEPLSEPKLTATSTSKILQSVMALQDYCTYTMRFKSLAAVIRHAKDWYVPESNNVKKGNFNLSSAINSLKSKFTIELPSSYKLKIDDKEQEYYPVEAGIHLLPEGGVVIYDGYGGEIRMAGGHITISAPGGINIHSGTDTQIWSGRNLSVRAKDSIDQSATKGSVRLKAEKNLELLGGNEEQTSGVIIESKGKGSMDFSQAGDKVKVGGIVLKSEEGTISSIAGTLYLSSSEKGSGIMIDSAKGRRNIYTASKMKEDYVNSRYALNFGDFSSGNIEKVYESTKNLHTEPCPMYVDGIAEILGHVLVDGSIQCDQHIYTKQAKTNPMVSPITGKAATTFDKSIRDAGTYVNTTSVNTSTTQYTGSVKTSFYDDKKPGNDETKEKAGFSYRTDSELNLGEFYVYADRWQTICTTGSAWEEKKVTTKVGDGEYPYPGKKYFKNKPCYVTQELVFCNDSNVLDHGSGPNIDDKYLNPEYNAPKVKSLDEYTSMG